MHDQAMNLRSQCRENQTASCKTIAIVSGKGGVGKSNTAINFGIELQKRKKKVLLFDLDIGMGNIDILLGKSPSYTIVHLFNDFLPISDMIETGPKGLSYLAGGSSLNELFTLKQHQLDYFFSEYEKLMTKYDYILFDLGAGVSEATMSFALASDECFVLTTPEPTSITDAYSMIKHLVIKNRLLPIYVIMNRCVSKREGEASLHKFQEVILQFLHKDIVKLGVLPNDAIVSTAVSRQIPYILFKENAPVSKALKKMVSDYLHQPTKGESEKQVSFLHKLKQIWTAR